ncbi:MAG: 1-acyl-sn-glycerol-3-phosphate acyltransferase [Deltaproteobacteria bacterium]|nr:1-acyl-sn-glycerol-3-phosphate acyltransferase [Deltaproteobacteria bacterium]
MSDRRFKLPSFGRSRPAPDAPPMFRFNAERGQIVAEVVARASETLEGREVETLLVDAAYLETKRLQERPDSEEAREKLPSWRDLARRIPRMGDGERARALDGLVREHAQDVAGNFDPRVYHLASKILPVALTAAIAPGTLVSQALGRGGLMDRITVESDHLEALRALSRKATLVVTPTHLSNLDSIVLGFALDREGLPPMTYGAGKNLFSNPLISFFMHNLGAYRVDRRIKHELYKHVLKTYSTVILERGYHSIFFPGGTRSRSGSVESKVKLGLLGTGIEAFTRNLRARKSSPLVVYVPTSINFLLTLEAESLIEDYLKEAGKARYIIEDDEFSRADRWLSLISGLMRLKSAVYIRFGQPLDPFGNAVLADGRSVDPRGREVDPASYVLRSSEPVVDALRDAEYTRQLGQTLVDHFARETVLLSTHICARVLFEKLGAAFPDADLFQRLRLHGQLVVPRDEVVAGMDALRSRLVALEDQGKLRVGRVVRQARPAELLERALLAWRDYHGPHAAAEWREGQVALGDLELLYYYQNRLSVFGRHLGASS